MRKVIQIAVEGANEETCSCLYALADDGTMWMKNKIGYRHDPDNFEQPWQQIENIPQASRKNPSEIFS